MANPLRGEVAFTVELKGEAKASPELARFDGQTFTLRYSSDALVQVEDTLDRGILDIGMEMMRWKGDPSRMRFGFVRALLWGGLRDYHADIDLKSAGDLMLAGGGIMTLMPKIVQAMECAFPKAETKEARPTNRASRRAAKATAGTGKNS